MTLKIIEPRRRLRSALQVPFGFHRGHLNSIYLFELFSAHGAHLQLVPVLVEQHGMGIMGCVPRTAAVVHPAGNKNSHVCSL